MANQSDELFNRRFALLLLGAVLAAVGVGLWFERQALLQHFKAHAQPPKHDNGYHPRGPVPAPPQWVKDVPEVPEWWNEVVVTNYDEDLSDHDKFAQEDEMEKAIQDKVVRGISPMRERRELIKYITIWTQSSRVSTNDLGYLTERIARAYEGLGECKMSAKTYVDLAIKDGRDWGFYGLAFQYERAGDNQAALQVYNFMIDSYRNGSMDHELGKVGKSRLDVVTNDCVLRKPEWWGQYEEKPEWWADVKVDLPKFTCFDDGMAFVNEKWRDGDPRKIVKALTALLNLEGMTYAEKIRAARSVGRRYSAAGDHHRAIESAWKIPGQLACNPFECTNSLNFIAREFDKLGETNHAKEVRDAIPCFSKWPRDIARK